jgi:hypothetical protein
LSIGEKARRRWLVLYTQHEEEEEEEEERGGVQELRPCVTDMEFLIDPPRGGWGTVYVFVPSSSRSSIPSYTHTHTNTHRRIKEGKDEELHVTSAVERWHKFSFPFSAVPPSSTDRQ